MGSQPKRRSSDPTRESEFLLCQASRLTPPLRQQFSSSPVLVSPLTLLLSTPSSLARAGFRKVTVISIIIIIIHCHHYHNHHYGHYHHYKYNHHYMMTMIHKSQGNNVACVTHYTIIIICIIIIIIIINHHQSSSIIIIIMILDYQDLTPVMLLITSLSRRS